MNPGLSQGSSIIISWGAIGKFPDFLMRRCAIPLSLPSGLLFSGWPVSSILLPHPVLRSLWRRWMLHVVDPERSRRALRSKLFALCCVPRYGKGKSGGSRKQICDGNI